MKSVFSFTLQRAHGRFSWIWSSLRTCLPAGRRPFRCCLESFDQGVLHHWCNLAAEKYTFRIGSEQHSIMQRKKKIINICLSLTELWGVCFLVRLPENSDFGGFNRRRLSYHEHIREQAQDPMNSITGGWRSCRDISITVSVFETFGFNPKLPLHLIFLVHVFIPVRLRCMWVSCFHQSY